MKDELDIWMTWHGQNLLDKEQGKARVQKSTLPHVCTSKHVEMGNHHVSSPSSITPQNNQTRYFRLTSHVTAVSDTVPRGDSLVYCVRIGDLQAYDFGLIISYSSACCLHVTFFSRHVEKNKELEMGDLRTRARFTFACMLHHFLASSTCTQVRTSGYNRTTNPKNRQSYTIPPQSSPRAHPLSSATTNSKLDTPCSS